MYIDFGTTNHHFTSDELSLDDGFIICADPSDYFGFLPGATISAFHVWGYTPDNEMGGMLDLTVTLDKAATASEAQRLLKAAYMAAMAKQYGSGSTARNYYFEGFNGTDVLLGT